MTHVYRVKEGGVHVASYICYKSAVKKSMYENTKPSLLTIIIQFNAKTNEPDQVMQSLCFLYSFK